MKTGKISRLTDRGFGFISQEGEEKDLFFHATELVDVEYNDLQEGDEVTFEVAEGPKGLNAVNVQRA
jgi:CspA family cold shock protein